MNWVPHLIYLMFVCFIILVLFVILCHRMLTRLMITGNKTECGVITKCITLYQNDPLMMMSGAHSSLTLLLLSLANLKPFKSTS